MNLHTYGNIMNRTVIIHYHMFKNAGTSVDKILKENFGDNWIEIEGKNNKKLSSEEMAEFILANPNIKAISSHTATVSPPKLDETITVFPVFFMRHPICRIQSAYNFEKHQSVQTPGAIKAKEGDFENYLYWRLSSPAPWQVMNFHAMRLKDFHNFTPARQVHLLRNRCIDAIKSMPFIGIVENFDVSMRRYSQLISPYFPQFKTFDVMENRTSDPNRNLADKLADIENEIGRSAFTKLLHMNIIDVELYNWVREYNKNII